jgi:hypothetical protein
MRRILAGLAVAAAFAVAGLIPSTALAKTCSSSYTHAVIGGAQKCLRAGEFCARYEQRQYLRYGFSCSNYVDGEYHLRRSR